MSPPSSYERRWLILALIAIAQLMIVLDLTIVNIALPSAQQDLGFSNDERQWVITAYALAFGSLLLLGGKLGDLFGRKWAFIGGLFGFAAASAVGGAAGSFGVLVAARATQGVFAALLAPSALALLAITFSDPAERGKAFGIYGAVAGGGSAVGLLLGGILTEWLNWRWCLYVNLLIAVPTAIVALRLIENVAQPARPRLDLVGTALSTCGAVRARLRLLELRVALLGAPGDDRRAGARRGAAHRVRVRRVARGVPAVAAASGRRPRARRLLPGARDLGRRPVRGVPVPDLLPAADQGLLADRDRPRLPPDDGGDHRQRDAGDQQLPRQDRSAPAARARHDARRAGDGVVRAARHHVELRRPRAARPRSCSGSGWATSSRRGSPARPTASRPRTPASPPRW